MATGAVIAVVLAAAPAYADRVYPSAEQVQRAQTAVTTAASRVEVLDAQLGALRAHLAEVQDLASAAAEAANGARLAAEKAATEATEARSAARTARTAADDSALALSRYAAGVYEQTSTLGELGVFLDDGGPQAVLDRASGIEAVGTEQDRVLREAQSTSLLATTLERAADEAQARALAAAKVAQDASAAAQAQLAAAQTEADRVAAEQTAVTAEVAALRRTSVALEQRRQMGLAADEQQRRERLERERVERERLDRIRREQEAHKPKPKPTTPSPTSTAPSPAPTDDPTPTPTQTPDPPPVKGGVGSVLAYARAQLGKPYVWAAAGPNTFDCSGLTMMAWRQAGVHLSHYTGAQWNETSRVPLDALRPGDLVFYGSSGASSFHVGLYIGGGQMIHAPHPGDVVKISSIYYMSGLLPYGGRP
jgi:cell wall-associated NlpC family hydrolase